MANITYRTPIPTPPASTTVKNAPLTHEEIDGNFKSLDNSVADLTAVVQQVPGVVATQKAAEAAASAAAAAESAGIAVSSETVAVTNANISTSQAVIATNAATTATSQAGIATTGANTATSQATIATTQAGIASAQAGIATTAANNAGTFATNASNSANSSLISANASKTSSEISAAATAAQLWVSGVGYLEGALVWSQLDARVYRRLVTGAGTTDPSLDNVNWFRLSRVVEQQDVGTDPNQVPLNLHLGNLAYQNADSIAGDVLIGGTVTYNGSLVGSSNILNIGNGQLYKDVSGNVGIGTDSPTTGLDVNFNGIRIRTARTPAAASASGNVGDICWDTNYMYICISTNTWKRVAITTW
jgi:hypothetical protein